jgi:hypothetical protein
MREGGANHRRLIVGGSVVLGIALLSWPALALQLPSTDPTQASVGKPVYPDAGVRGQELTVHLKGISVSSGSSCSFGAGIDVVSCGPALGGSVAKLKISSRAVPGYRTVVVKGPRGAAKSLPKSFRVTLSGNGGSKSGGADSGGGTGGAGGAAPGGAGGMGGGAGTIPGQHGDQQSPDTPPIVGSGAAGGTGGIGGAGDPSGDGIVDEGPTDALYGTPPGSNEPPPWSAELPSIHGNGGPGWNDPPLPPGLLGGLDDSTQNGVTGGETTSLQLQQTTRTVPGPGTLISVGLGTVLLIGLRVRLRRPAPSSE